MSVEDESSSEIQEPSREQFRAQRREKRSYRRRKLLGIPLILVGLALMVGGALVWMDDGGASPAPSVAGTTQTPASSTTTIP